jgi:hypothetical protein
MSLRMLFPASSPFYSLVWISLFWVLMKSKTYMPPILSLAQSLQSVLVIRASMISICTKDSCSRATNFAFPCLCFGFYSYKNCMVVVLWDTLDERRHMQCSQLTTIGQECTATWNAFADGVQHAYKLSPLPTPMAFIHRYLFLMLLGPI